MIRNYFKVAFRNFRRHKLFTLINIVGLSIGISASVVIYLIAHYDFTFDKFYPNADRIYRIVNESSEPNGKSYISGVDGPIPEAVKNEVTGLSQSAPFYTIDEWALNRTGVVIPAASGTPLKFKYSGDMILADSRYFDLFPYKWLAGEKSSLNKPFTVVLTSQRATKYFPGLSYDQMIGKTVIYGDTVKTTVTGIVEEHQKNTDFNFNDFLSYSTANHVAALKQNLALDNWGSITPSSQFFVKLADKTSLSDVERQLGNLLKKHLPPNPPGDKSTRALRLEKLSDLHFDEQYSSWGARTASKTTLYGLLAIAAFLLLLGCINFINLTTAQSVQRAKEIGIRKTMGSSRRELIVQFLSETFLLTLIAVIVSCALTPVILKLFAGFIPPGIKLDLLHQPDLLLFLSLLTIVVSLLSGFYPATVLSSFKPVQVLKNQSKNHAGETRNALLRKTLTVTQFAIAQFFIMATIMVSKQVYYALHKDLGFKKEAILSITTPWNKDASLRQVYINQVKALPQVELVSIGGASPSSDNTHSTNMTYLDGKKEVKINAQERFGDENYIKVYGIKLLAGRNIQPNDVGKAFLVNVSFVRALGFKDPADAVNNFVQYNGKKMLVAGVIGDFYYRSLHTAIEPLVVVNRSDNGYFSSTLHIALKPQSAGGDDWQRAIASMQGSFRKIYTDNDFQYQFFDDAIAQFYAGEQHTSTLLGWATGLSVLISCMGLLGLAIYTTNQRTKEIGVRKVLGATVKQIVILLSTEMALLIVMAFVIISPVAWWAMNKWMQDFADRTAISWWIFALSGGGMLLTTLFTSGFQTIKAAMANPVKSLRSE
jgi:putative ABC transport system permease protein